jgi:hypothetical protein
LAQDVNAKKKKGMEVVDDKLFMKACLSFRTHPGVQGFYAWPTLSGDDKT